MKRRDFLYSFLSISSIGILSSSRFIEKKEKVRFGIITDLHYADVESNNTRYYRDTKLKLKAALKDFEKSNLDFIIELGDLKDQNKIPDKNNTLSFLKEIEESLQSYHGEVYHVLGNHDMDSISKKEFLSNISNSGNTNGKSYYSFKKGGIKFIVLDANFNEDGSDYSMGNFNWEVALIPDNEILWLKNELKEGNEPVIIFIHQLLDNNNNLYKGLYVRNADQVNEILKESNKVLAVFQGHHHAGSYSLYNDIHYYTLKGMIEGAYPQHNSYAIIEISLNNDIILKGFGNISDKYMYSMIK